MPTHGQVAHQQPSKVQKPRRVSVPIVILGVVVTAFLAFGSYRANHKGLPRPGEPQRLLEPEFSARPIDPSGAAAFQAVVTNLERLNGPLLAKAWEAQISATEKPENRPGAISVVDKVVKSESYGKLLDALESPTIQITSGDPQNDRRMVELAQLLRLGANYWSLTHRSKTLRSQAVPIKRYSISIP